MIHFRCRADVEAAGLPDAVRKLVLGRIDDFERVLGESGYVWEVDRDGHFSLLAEGEAGLPLEAMGWTQRLADLLFESVCHHPEAGLWEAVYIPGNNWGWTCFVPDTPDLPPALREAFLREAVPP